MEIERAEAISEVAQTLINSAKVELQFLEMTAGQTSESEFLGPQKSNPLLPAARKPNSDARSSNHERRTTSHR
ncbi:hypothetical protein LCGC14_0673520 [marine sediment metagenome]|uniref:Uncharacterized protein n=1 Tax=marine sediment metagenome TaxID=412755 RepID=A0A0F9TBQ9_9ZZZZ